MKHLFTTFAAVMLCLGVSAQDGKKGTNEFSFNVGYDFGLKKGQGGMVTFQPEYGRNFTDQFYLGAGTGLPPTTSSMRSQSPCSCAPR